MEALADRLGFVQTFLFLDRFLFLFFSSSVSLFYVSARALNMSAILQINGVLRFDASLTCKGTSLPAF